MVRVGPQRHGGGVKRGRKSLSGAIFCTESEEKQDVPEVLISP